MLNRRDFGLAAFVSLLAGATGVIDAHAQARRGGARAGAARGGARGGQRGGARGGARAGGAASLVLPFGTDPSFLACKPQAIDPEEKKILEVIDEIESERNAGIPTNNGRFLRLLTLFAGARSVVEIGTARGLSALWFAMALQKTGGKLITHQRDPDDVKDAQASFKKAGVEDIITVVTGDPHEKVKTLKAPIDILFQNADTDGYNEYLGTLLPKVRRGGLVISHNINTRQADPTYLQRITSDPKLETLLVTLQDTGISLSLKKQ